MHKQQTDTDSMLKLTKDQRLALISIYDKMNDSHFEILKDFEEAYITMATSYDEMTFIRCITEFDNKWGVNSAPSYRPGGGNFIVSRISILQEFTDTFEKYITRNRVAIDTIHDLAYGEIKITEALQD
mgnify:CR=1 FL=1